MWILTKNYDENDNQDENYEDDGENYDVDDNFMMSKLVGGGTRGWISGSI